MSVLQPQEAHTPAWRVRQKHFARGGEFHAASQTAEERQIQLPLKFAALDRGLLWLGIPEEPSD